MSLSLQTPEELEDDSDFEQEDYDVRSRTSVQTEDDQLIAGQSARVSRDPTSLQWVSKPLPQKAKAAISSPQGCWGKDESGLMEVLKVFFMSNLFK